jgi:hypothetical protein
VALSYVLPIMSVHHPPHPPRKICPAVVTAWQSSVSPNTAECPLGDKIIPE